MVTSRNAFGRLGKPQGSDMKVNYKEINDQMLAAMETHGTNWINPMRSLR